MLQTSTASAVQSAGNDTARAPSSIIIVEDDAPLRALLARLLTEDGYDAMGVADGQELARAMGDPHRPPADLILLDIMLPGESGLSLCRRIREASPVPVIIVSARGQEADRVAGLEAGADDYIAKPFGRSELLARIRAVLRRAGETRTQLQAPAPVVFEFAGWRYLARRHELYAPSGAEVALTAAEHELLLTLLRNPQRMIGRERLMELSRNRIASASDRAIDVLVSRLRAKMGGARRTDLIIKTIRGVGYMLVADVTQS